MSLFPAFLTLTIVMMLAVSSARVAQDAGLSASQHIDAQLARLRAEAVMHRAAVSLVDDERVVGDADDVSIEEVMISDQAELGDLPLKLHRITVTGRGHQASIRLQADYVRDACESEYDETCTRRVRRIAWRELPF